MDYPTCEETYVTLRIYPGDIDPDEISKLLSLAATEIQRAGQPNPSKSLPGRVYRLSGWFLSSQRLVQSTDSQVHLDWLFRQLDGRQETLAALRARGAAMDVACFWVSANGHGGPTLSPERAAMLSQFGLPLWFDVYFGDDGA